MIAVSLGNFLYLGTLRLTSPAFVGSRCWQLRARGHARSALQSRFTSAHGSGWGCDILGGMHAQPLVGCAMTEASMTSGERIAALGVRTCCDRQRRSLCDEQI
jgi:hypothetical protein